MSGLSTGICVQATVSGFRLVDRDNVFRVCDQPHPLLVKEIVDHCSKARVEPAYLGMKVGVGYQPCHQMSVLFTYLGPAVEHAIGSNGPHSREIAEPKPRHWQCAGRCGVVGRRLQSDAFGALNVQKLFDDGYSATDIITTLFRIVRNADLQEWVKLEYIKVRPYRWLLVRALCLDGCARLFARYLRARSDSQQTARLDRVDACTHAFAYIVL